MSRKYRWSFTGYDADERVVFPHCFIKLSSRPVKPFGPSPLQYVPYSFNITQYHTLYDDSNQAQIEFDKHYPLGEKAVSGELVLYDGCGVVMERWELDEMKMKCISAERDECGIVAEWKIDYFSCEYKSEHEWDLSLKVPKKYRSIEEPFEINKFDI